MISTYKERTKSKLFPWYRKQINEKAHFRYHMDECYCNFIKTQFQKRYLNDIKYRNKIQKTDTFV